MELTAANPIKLDDEEDKENSSPTTITTLESERPTEPQITEKPSILDSTRKCAWFRIQDSVSLNFVCVCIWSIACVLYIQVIDFFFKFIKLF